MRVGALAATVMASASATVTKPGPVIWSFLGMPFEAPSMVAGLFGVTVTRIIIGQSDKTSKWLVRVPVDVLAIGATFFVIVDHGPAMLASLGIGITAGTLGATIIKIAERYGMRVINSLFPEVPTIPPPPPPA